MDQNYLIDLVSGLFGNKKKNESLPSARVYISDSSGLTGVARYLKSQEIVPVLSGVARYLKNMEELSPANVVAGDLDSQEIAGRCVGSNSK